MRPRSLRSLRVRRFRPHRASLAALGFRTLKGQPVRPTASKVASSDRTHHAVQDATLEFREGWSL